MKLKISDYFVLLILFLFTIGSSAIVFVEQGEEVIKFICIAVLFGLGFVFWLGTMIYKYRQQKIFSNGEAEICLPLETPIRMSKSKIIMLASGIIVAGIAVYQFEQGNQVLFACGVLMIVFGGSLFLATLCGLAANESFVFKPEGIEFIRSTYSFVITWDNINSYSSGEYYDNPAFIIAVSRMEDVLETIIASDPQKAKKKLAKRFHWDKMVLQEHAVMIMPGTYNINLADLHHTVAFCLEKYHNLDS